MSRFCYLLAIFWGFFWAFVLQTTAFGRWLVIKRTWLTVVIGVGVDGLLLLPVVPFAAWLKMLAVVSLSAVGIIARSLVNELTEDVNVIRAAKNE